MSRFCKCPGFVTTGYKALAVADETRSPSDPSIDGNYSALLVFIKVADPDTAAQVEASVSDAVLLGNLSSCIDSRLLPRDDASAAPKAAMTDQHLPHLHRSWRLGGDEGMLVRQHARNAKRRSQRPFNLRFPLPEEQPRARFFVRASGRALAVGSAALLPLSVPAVRVPMDLRILHSLLPSGQATRMVGQVELPIAGDYFIEVVKIFDDLIPQNLSMSQRQCTSPSPEQPVLQAQYTLTEDMQPAGSPAGGVSIPALWVNSGSAPFGPLLTRIQNCNAVPNNINSRNILSRLAHEPTKYYSKGALRSYKTAHGGSYVWSTYNVHTSQSTPVPSYSRKVSGLCVLGASHARNLCEGLNCTNLWLTTLTEKRQLPRAAGLTCKVILLHVGQWDLGWPEKKVTPWETFEHNFKALLVEIKQWNVPHFVMETNYNPLNCQTTMCPPRDWRTPPMVDTLNAIMHRTANAMDVPLIPTRDIVAPLWDSAPDWCHPKGRLFNAVASRVSRFICERNLTTVVC